MVIPKPLCRCAVCVEARQKGIPYARTGPAVFIHDIDLLIDTPAEIISQLNRERIKRIDALLFTHADPDHVEGFRVVEQIALDFRTWRAYPKKETRILMPRRLYPSLQRIKTTYGPALDYYERQGFARILFFDQNINVGNGALWAVPVTCGEESVFIYVFEYRGKKMVYAPCDIKPFPEEHAIVQAPDVLIIQPGIFETGLAHEFEYPEDHISRNTLYTFEETLSLAHRIQAARVVCVHLEEYWNRGYDDYRVLEKKYSNVQFAYDGMEITL